MRYLRTLLMVLALGLAGLPIFMALKSFPVSPPQESFSTQLSEQTSLKNGVTAMLTVFRPVETLGCLLGLLGSLVAILSLSSQETPPSAKEQPYESVVLSVITSIYFPLGLVFALYLLLYGFNLPGGGIQGGIMLSACSILFFLSFGHQRFEDRFQPRYLLLFSSWGLLLFSLGFLGLTFIPALATPAGIMPLEVGLLISVGAVLVAIFWALAQEEG